MTSSWDLASCLVAFAIVVLPMLVVGVAGEALWMSIDPPWPGRRRLAGRGERASASPGSATHRQDAAAGLWVRSLVGLGNVHRRMLAVYFAIIGPRAAYRITEVLARRLYRLLVPLRARSEAQCHAALAHRVVAADVPRIAEQAFVHRIWNLTDLALADRLLHPRTYHRYGGRLPTTWLLHLRDAQSRRQPLILLTAYYGPFDLLPLLLGYNGIRAGVVYLPHVNRGFDEYRRRIRGRSGCELIPVDRAAGRLGRILEAGGTVALLADHHVEQRGMPVTFLGLPTQAMRSVGLLAWRYEADVVVAGIRRVNQSFCFEVFVADILDHHTWTHQDDAVAYVTERSLRGLERMILDDPSQYLWGHARWGEELARRLTTGERETPCMTVLEPATPHERKGRAG